MRRSLRRVGLVAMTILGARGASAQTADSAAADPCGDVPETSARVCLAAVEGSAMLHPTLGLLLGGGAPILGTAEGMGRFGTGIAMARATVAMVALPDPGYDGTADTVPELKRVSVVAPRLDVAVGLVAKTLPMGTVTADLLGSIQFVPINALNPVSVDLPARRIGDVALGFGYGIRLGFAGVPPLPLASLSVTKHDAPRLRVGDLDAGATTSSAIRASAINGRLLLGRKFGILNVNGRAGMDLYGGDVAVTVRDPVTDSLLPTRVVPLSSQRLVALLSAGLEFPFLRIAGEAGFQIGKDDGLTTIFANNDPRAGKFFGGFGIGIKL